MVNIPEWLGNEETQLRDIALMADELGYGNVIAHLQREWMVRLMTGNLDIDEAGARLAVINREPYPLEFHRPSGLRPILKKGRLSRSTL